MDRLVDGLHLKNVEPLFVFYGDTNDQFVDKSLKFVSFIEALHAHCFSIGYERVIFYNNIDNIYFIDQQSRDLLNNPKAHVSIVNKNKVATEKKILLKNQTSQNNSFDDIFGTGPLDDLQNVDLFSVEENQPEIPANDRLFRGGEEVSGKYHYNTIDDAEAVRIMDTAIQDQNIRTVLVIDNFDRYTAQTAQLNNFFKQWSEIDQSKNINKCLVIIPESRLEDLGRNTHYTDYPIIQSLLTKGNCLKQINKPKDDELKRLIQYYHLRRNKDIDWRDLKSLLMVMRSQQLRVRDWISCFEDDDLLDISFSSIQRLAGKKNSLNPKAFNVNSKTPQEELSSLIGMQELKDTIDKIVADNNNPSPVNKTRRHIVFRGNPGTGKTISARIIARILQQEGVLSSGHLIETDGSGLIAQYVGHTRAKVNELCDNALGGVLFIDEAYSIAKGAESGGSSFSQEAVDTLLKRMEDDRDDLIVILAGYSDDMDNLLKMNEGFSSRIGYTVDFKDYTPEQLFEIANKFSIKPSALDFSEELIVGLRNVFKYLYDSREKGFSNARMVENIIQDTISNHNTYCQKNNILVKDIANTSVQSSCLPEEYVDFANPEYSENLLKQSMQNLNQMIGLQSVKHSVNSMVKSVQVNRIRADMNNNEHLYAGHFLFKGNPGTGKTTVAREFGLILKALGMLKKGHVVEIQGEDLVGSYVGQTSDHAEAVIKSALDGVLFIDEAYGLAGNPNDNSDFFASAQNKLLKLMEDYNHRLVVIAAGYPKDLDRFIDSNAGFKRRFSNEIIFEDYNADELLQIIQSKAEKLEFTINEDALPEILGYFEYIKRQSKDSQFGNAGEALKVWNTLRSFLDDRIYETQEELSKEIVMTITTLETAKLPMPDLYRQMNNPNYLENALEDSMRNINEMIGLYEVKNYINGLVDSLNLEKSRESKGLATAGTQSIGHFLFAGSPGTGKTVVAREFAKILYALGLTKKNNHVIEIQGEDLVAGFIGKTSSHAQELIESAFGGVLFIDEAYGLVGNNNQGGDFFKTAQNKLLKYMEDHSDKLVVIAAGYEEQLEELLTTNPGFPSRFTNHVTFNDYSVEELLKILHLYGEKEGYIIESDASDLLKDYIQNLKMSIPQGQFGNARVVRNIWNSLKMILNRRLSKLDLEGITDEKMMTIISQDVNELIRQSSKL